MHIPWQILQAISLRFDFHIVVSITVYKAKSGRGANCTVTDGTVFYHTENKRSSIWQLCCHWWYCKLSFRQLTVSPMKTKFSNLRPLVFNVMITTAGAQSVTTNFASWPLPVLGETRIQNNTWIRRVSNKAACVNHTLSPKPHRLLDFIPSVIVGKDIFRIMEIRIWFKFKFRGILHKWQPVWKLTNNPGILRYTWEYPCKILKWSDKTKMGDMNKLMILISLARIISRQAQTELL